MDKKDIFLDLYSEKEKLTVHGLKVKISPFNDWLTRFLFIFINIFWVKPRFVHFHFSGLVSCCIFIFLPKRKSKWVLTLHSGNVVRFSSRLGGVDAFFLKRALTKFDLIHAVSESQALFYQDYVDRKRIVVAPTYIPPNASLLSCSYADSRIIKDVVSKMKSDNRFILLTSGYPSPIYNFDKFCDGVLNLGDGYCGVVVVYGPGSDEYVAEKKKAFTDNSIVWISGLNQSQFLGLQKKADCYVRLTQSDSFGIAVADSVELGTPALATDVCERYPGAEIVPEHDVDSWTDYLPVKISHNDKRRLWSFLSVAETLYK